MPQARLNAQMDMEMQVSRAKMDKFEVCANTRSYVRVKTIPCWEY
jgi:hypothetical protein